MGGRALDAAPGCGDEAFNGGGVESACEFLFFGFDSCDDGNCQEFFVDAPVEIEDLKNFDVCFFLCEVGGVTLLPEEFTGTKEWLCEKKILVETSINEASAK